MLKRRVEKGTNGQSKKSRVPQEQQKLPFAFDIRLYQILGSLHQVAARFRRANGARNGDLRLLLWQFKDNRNVLLSWQIEVARLCRLTSSYELCNIGLTMQAPVAAGARF